MTVQRGKPPGPEREHGVATLISCPVIRPSEVREQNRTADLFITIDPALNAVLTPENPTISTVSDVRCAQSYLLWLFG